MSSLPGDVTNKLGDVRNTFSSWDSCMAHSYCKWPAIIGIVIGSLILLSVVWCVASCLCCGASLCGSCVQCLTCFRCCGACGKRGGGGGGRTRHKDDYTSVAPSPYNGYQPQASPMAYQPPSAAPQFAQFDASNRKIHDDSLPAMPTWESARTRRIEDHSVPPSGFSSDLEMGTIATGPPQQRARGAYNQVPNGPVSPMSPPVNYGQFRGQAHPYSSDLGAQRLGQQQTGHTDFEPSPLSPAPTYRTAPSIATGYVPDRHNRGNMSPTSAEYNNQSYFVPSRDQTWSPLNGGQHERIDYQSYTRSISPPQEHQPLTHNYDQQEQSGVRPPSLLQIGRKPVRGSQREI